MEGHPFEIPAEFQHIQPEKKARILTSAMMCLAHYGYHGASIKRIADEAGVSKALIYNYYKSKDELVRDLMQKGMDRLMAVYTPEHDAKTIEEASRFIDKTFDIMDESPHFWKVYFSILTNTDVMHLIQPLIADEIIPRFYAMAKSWQKFGIHHTEEEFMFLGAVTDGLGFNYMINKEYFPRAYAIKRLKQLYGFE